MAFSLRAWVLSHQQFVELNEARIRAAAAAIQWGQTRLGTIFRVPL